MENECGRRNGLELNMNNELYHYGVKGMKWGVRKDRRQSGSGKSRRRGGKHVKSGYHPSLEQNIKGGKDKPNVSPAEKTAKEIEKVTRASSDISRRMSDAKKRRYKPEDLSRVSDQELRSRINRIEMERRYNSLKYEETRSGYDRVTDIIDTVGDAASASASVLTIAAIIYGSGMLKKGKH